ncbi:MAG: hypothetical protein LBO20_10020 [Bifidobacteriaceae bacterium]|jgi:hypothetical protein|nr:hypothetical protein [Bifidobacteriaceae bacterium]
MDTDLDTLVTALYVTIDDLLAGHPEWVPSRPKVGIAPKIADSEMITLAVMAALLGHVNERRWVRVVKTHLTGYFPHVPGQSGYNKRLRKLAETINFVRDWLARSTDQWCDGLWLADSTPVECGRPRTRTRHPDRPPTPRPDRRHLAQRTHRRTRPTLPHRLRSLNTLRNQRSSVSDPSTR